jgi:hypothetical protein
MNASQRNAKTMLGLGIVDMYWERNRGTTSIWNLTLLRGREIVCRGSTFGQHGYDGSQKSGGDASGSAGEVLM